MRLSAFVSALGSREMGHHKSPIIYVSYQTFKMYNQNNGHNDDDDDILSKIAYLTSVSYERLIKTKQNSSNQKVKTHLGCSRHYLCIGLEGMKLNEP